LKIWETIENGTILRQLEGEEERASGPSGNLPAISAHLSLEERELHYHDEAI